MLAVGMPELAPAPGLGLSVASGGALLADPALAPLVSRVILLTMTSLIAVLQNGKRRAPGIPFDARGVLPVTVGEDSTVLARLVEPDGSPIILDFPAGDSITLTTRPSSSASPWARHVGVATATRGLYSFAIAAATYRRFGPARGVADITIVRQALTSRVWGLSTAILAA